MSAQGLALDPGWLASLRAGADLPPLRPRVPLCWGQAAIGSVEPGLFEGVDLPHGLARRDGPETEAPWVVQGSDLTASLAQLALALRHAGLAHAWRDEQLAVCGEDGMRLATVERGVVRPLGIATRAVHLAGVDPEGRHWIQQRSLTKANDPGLWDTLMGGMVSAADSLDQALARETWEEAGLWLENLQDVAWGGQLLTRRPSGDGGGRGYVVELIDWFRCVVPAGAVPVNQDGEVARFVRMDSAELARRMQAGEFTTEACLILAAHAGL